jgi:hypothetical protein
MTNELSRTAEARPEGFDGIVTPERIADVRSGDRERVKRAIAGLPRPLMAQWIATEEGESALVDGDGCGRLDVRAQFEMADGAMVYAQFYGLISMNAAVSRALLGAATDFSDQYFRVTPRLETGSPDYAWMNQALFLGEGRFHQGLCLEYKLYRVA